VPVAGIFDRFDRLPEMRSALTAWSAYVSRIVTGKASVNVVPFVRS
jgi:hypothetical protein